MNYRKHGLKALGLSFLAVLGLMAFAASGVQAKGTVTVEGSSLEVTFIGKQDEKEGPEQPLQGRLEILTLNMEIRCHKASASGNLSATGTGLATITFEVCLAKGTGGGAICEIPNIVATAKVLLILHSGGANLGVDLVPQSAAKTEHSEGTGEPYILFTPDDLLTFAKVLNHTPCALPEISNVKGCVVAKITTGNAVEQLITVKGFATSLFGCELKYGTNLAHLTGVDAVVSLTGTHKSMAWGVE